MATALLSITPECSICCDCFKTPKVLPCGHTFCLNCLERYIGCKTETFPCPICQQDVEIPDGGAKKFITIFIVPTSPHTTRVTGTTSPTTQATGTTSPTTQVKDTTSHTTHLTNNTVSKVKYHCPCHSERQIDYYCLTCHCMLCHKCFLKEHIGHESLDVECETAKEKATELVLTSEKFIQNKIKDLEETHAALLEAKKTIQRFTEDACSRITKQTDKIIADIKTGSERIMTDIKNKSEESESKLTKTVENIVGDIKNFKLKLETNLPSLTEDCALQILVSCEKIKELEELCKDVKVRIPSVEYLDWDQKRFSLDFDILGSMVLKQYHNLRESNSYRFIFNINDIKKDCKWYYCEDRFSYRNLVWSCFVVRNLNGIVHICFQLLEADNPTLNYCIVDGQISLWNIGDTRKTVTDRDCSNMRLRRGSSWSWWYPISWSSLTDKNQGFLNSNGQFVVTCDIIQIKEISLE